MAEPSDHRLVRNRPSRARPVGGRGGPKRRKGFRKACLVGIAFCSSLLFIAAIVGGLLFARLSTGPFDVGLGRQIAAALGERVGQGYGFSVGTTLLEMGDNGPRLAVRQFTVRDRSGRTVVAAPRAGVSVDLAALLYGKISPKRLEVEDVVFKVVRREDGQVAMTAGSDEADVPLAGPLVNRGTAGEGGGGSASDDAAQPASGAAAGLDGQRITRDLTAVVNNLVDVLFDPASPLRAVDRFGIERGTLDVDDRPRKASMRYRNFTVDFDRQTGGGIFVTAGADGPSGHWSFSARVNRNADGGKLVDITADHLSVDEVMLAGGVREVAFDTDMPLSLNGNFEIGRDGVLSRADGLLRFGSGYFRIDDPDHEPVMMDSASVPLHLDPLTGAVRVDRGALQAGETTFGFSLAAEAPGQPGDPWRVTGDASGTFGAERPGEKPIAMNKIALAADIDAARRRVALNRFSIDGPSLAFRVDAVWQGNTDGKGFAVTGSMDLGRTPGSDVLRLWPNWVAASPRAWLLANLRGGTLTYGRGRFALTDTDLLAMRWQHSVPDDHSHIEVGVANMGLAFMPDVPPLTGVDGICVVTGSTTKFTASKGGMEVSPGHVLGLGDGSFTIPNTDPKPTPAVVDLRVTGRIDALADLLSRDALKSYANLPIDASSVAGDIDGRLNVGLLLGDRVPSDSVKVGVTASVRNFSADKLIGKEPLQDATLNIVADRSGLRAKGEGRMFGSPTTIDIKKPAGGAPSEAVLGITLDDAARAKAGLNLGKTLTGPVSARITTSLTSIDKARATLDVDFTKAAFDGPLPGLKKPTGRPAKATCQVQQGNDQTVLDGIVFDSGPTSIRGSVALSGGAFQSARISQLRLSPGDDMRVDAEPSGANGLKLIVRGSNIDARPFIKQFVSDDGAAAGGPGKDIDLDLHANLVTGQNNQALSNADLRLSRVGGQLRRVQMNGRLGHGTASINTVGQGASAVVVVLAKDAGATLSFVDLYKRMDGGRLDANLRFGADNLEGFAVVRDFTIKEDPAIKKLAQEEIPSNSRNAGAHIDSSAVHFSKLEANFVRNGSRVDIRDGAMFGPQMGATVEGSVDFTRDRVALRGTFVPVYGLNNLFSQIPVVGVLLGGGTHEGLFAVNYRIDGSAATPVMTFDPLSALAPGIFRKIFGALDGTAQSERMPRDANGLSAAAPERDHADGPARGALGSD